MARIKGGILLPSDLEISCNSDRLVDYAVCHRFLANIARLQSFAEGPWKTHQALLSTLPSAPESYLTRSLSTAPMKIPPIARNNVSPVTWSECVKLSDSHSFRQPDRRLPGFLDLHPNLTQQLALEYRRWSCASEAFVLSTCEIEPRERRKYLGRASEDEFQLKPTVHRIPSAEEHVVERECRFWSRLSSRLSSRRPLFNVEKGSNSELRPSGFRDRFCVHSSTP